MNTAIQAYDPETQRLALLERYNPHEHILSWVAFNKKTNLSETVRFYPASWRLYELNLKYPEAKFDVEFVHMDYEKDFCILRAKLYIGDAYETSPRRASALKQGKISQIDKCETQAKARAARDMGISTELALDCDDSQGQVVGTIVTAESAPASQYDVVEAEETPRQLSAPEAQPQPTLANDQAQQTQPVDAQPAQPLPANVVPMKPKPTQASPQQGDGKLLPAQYNALKSLYLRINQEIPPDMGNWNFAQAATAISGLQQKLRQASGS